MSERLSQQIQLEFEVAPYGAAVRVPRQDYDTFSERQSQSSGCKDDFARPMKATASSASMPVPPPPRLHWSARTDPLLYSFYSNNNGRPSSVLRIRAIKDIYSKLPSKQRISSTPAPPVTARR